MVSTSRWIVWPWIITVFQMAIALGATGYFMAIDVPITPRAVVGCVIIYNAFFGYRYSSPLPLGKSWFVQKQSNSWGPIPWLYPPEIMPLTVRAKGVSLSTATNWFFNFIVGLVTPYLQEVIEWRLYPMHGFFCVCSFVVVYFCKYQSNLTGGFPSDTWQKCTQRLWGFHWRKWTPYLGRVRPRLFSLVRLYRDMHLI